MKKLFMVALLLVLATACYAQAPRAVWHESGSDVYLGYKVTNPDYSTFGSHVLNGVEAGYTKQLYPRVAITALAGFSTGPYSSKLFDLGVGPKVYITRGTLRTYIFGTLDYSHLSATGMYNGDHHPAIPATQSVSESGLSYRVGGGAEVQISRKFYWRVAQWDMNPEPWARHTPLYQNLSSGIGYKF